MLNIGQDITVGVESYKVVKVLGSGACGDTFLLERTAPSMLRVAVKIPKPHVLADAVWSAKFQREARILANINHRNVVRVLAVWNINGTTPAIVQELVDGAAELHQYIPAHAPDAPSLLLQTLYALRAFHTKTTPAAVHRDLSPRNILVAPDGCVKVIDFGLAKEDPRLTHILTNVGAWFGTPGCIAPEQMHDAGSVDPRADLFAIGRSFAASMQVRNPLHADPTIMAEPWKTICSKLAAHDAADRYASADAALRHAIELFGAAGISLSNLTPHIDELGRDTPIVGWSQLCSTYLLTHPIDIPLLRQIVLLHRGVYAPPFNACAVFDAIETSPAMASLQPIYFPFHDTDPVGEVYQALYGYLDSARRLKCFDRLCDLAVRAHRFALMDNLRAIYPTETDASIQAQHRTNLVARDPTAVIRGIPR